MKLLLLLCALAAGALAQAPAQRVQSAPDCVRSFRFSASAGTTSASFDNRYSACTSWLLVYSAVNPGGEVLTVQSAPDDGGTPGAFSAGLGTLVSGANGAPVAAYGSSSFAGYAPWARVVLDTASLNLEVTGVLVGWAAKTTPAVTSTGCVYQAAVSLTGSGNTQVIAAQAGKTVRVCELYLSAASAADVKLTRGTGANCGTGTADITGLFRSVSSIAINSANGIRAAAGSAVCINQSSSVNSGGLVVYAVE